METTVELDTSLEQPSANGHDATWQEFDSNTALLQHIFSTEIPEELVELPRWNVKILCRSLDSPTLVKVQIACYDEERKTTDYRKDLIGIVIEGCYNPTNKNKVFTEGHRANLKKYGVEVNLLASTILRLSGVLLPERENTRKN